MDSEEPEEKRSRSAEPSRWKPIQRSLKLSLELANTGKQAALSDLWNEYRRAVSDFLDRLLAHEDLSEDYLKGSDSRLSYRYRQCAKRQAMKLFKTWCRNPKKGHKPTLRHPMMTLDYRFVDVQKGGNAFDFWIKIATLEKGQPILLPAKSYPYLNGYLEGQWEMVPGGKLARRNGRWFLLLAFRKEKPARKEGRAKAVDIGYRKLAVTSDGEIIGAGLKPLIEKADRKQPASQGYYRAKAEIKNYVNREVKKLFTDDLATLVVEDLKRLKDGKRGKWSKDINRKFGFWIYGQALERVKLLGEISGVHVPRQNPAYSSQDCPLCGHRAKMNRTGERFACAACGFSHDADYVGALNILSRFTGQPIVAQDIKPLAGFSIL